MEYSDSFTPRPFQVELSKITVTRAIAGQLYDSDGVFIGSANESPKAKNGGGDYEPPDDPIIEDSDDPTPRLTVHLVWPGSGKTKLYQDVAVKLFRKGLIDHLVVYVPRLALTDQAETGWRHKVEGTRQEAGDFLLFDSRCRLEYLFHRGNVSPLMPLGYKRSGFVTTYSSLVSYPKLHLDWAKEHSGRFLLVADEAQFLGVSDKDDDEELKAGRYFERLSRYAQHTLMLTGTPNRADGRKLVLCDELYEEIEDGHLRLQPHGIARYSHSVMLGDEGYLRKFDSAIQDCHVNWDPIDGTPIEYDLSASGEISPNKRATLAKILRKDNVWQPICDKTVWRLRMMQKINKDYCAMIACMTIREAGNVARYLKEQYPTLNVVKATTDDGEQAEQTLKNFKTHRYDVLITVRKAFIGYDCAKITVIGVLTNYRDVGHLTQLVFRAGRVWNVKECRQAAEQQRLYIIVPDDPGMQKFIEYLRKEEDEGIRLLGEGGCGGGGGSEKDGLLDANETTTRGATLTDDVPAEQYAVSQALLDEFGAITTHEQLLSLVQSKTYSDFLNVISSQSTSSSFEVPSQPRRTSTPRTDREITKDWKSQAAQTIGRYLRECGHETTDENYSSTRAMLQSKINSAFESGIKSTEDLTTADETRRYLEHVHSFLRQRGL